MSGNSEASLKKVYELHDQDKAMMFLSWDRRVNMPKQGMATRTRQLTTLRGLSTPVGPQMKWAR
jgi:Zn-dependent M32 family carboxypeptidase